MRLRADVVHEVTEFVEEGLNFRMVEETRFVLRWLGKVDQHCRYRSIVLTRKPRPLHQWSGAGVAKLAVTTVQVEVEVTHQLVTVSITHLEEQHILVPDGGLQLAEVEAQQLFVDLERALDDDGAWEVLSDALFVNAETLLLLIFIVSEVPLMENSVQAVLRLQLLEGSDLVIHLVRDAFDQLLLELLDRLRTLGHPVLKNHRSKAFVAVDFGKLASQLDQLGEDWPVGLLNFAIGRNAYSLTGLTVLHIRQGWDELRVRHRYVAIARLTVNLLELLDRAERHSFKLLDVYLDLCMLLVQRQVGKALQLSDLRIQLSDLLVSLCWLQDILILLDSLIDEDLVLLCKVEIFFIGLPIQPKGLQKDAKA